MPDQVHQAFQGVDLILHAGDIYTSDCLDWLEQIAPVIAVEVAPAPVIGDSRVQHQRVMSLAGYSVGMIHDLMVHKAINEVIPGELERRFPKGESVAQALAEKFGTAVDTVVFGHTHYPMVEEHDGVLFINPGSPTLPKQIRRLGTVGILELTAEGREARIVDLAKL